MKQINYEVIRKNLDRLNRKTILVVKDNAYGCGLKNVLKIAISLGFTFFAVTEIKDALYIINNYSNTYVLVLGKNKVVSISNRIFLTVESKEDYFFCKRMNMPYHFKVISPMNRFGSLIDNEIINDSLCKGVYMHISRYDDDGIDEELKYFNDSVKNIKNMLIHIGGSHVLYKDNKYVKRIGMAIYENAVMIYGKVIKTFILERGQYLGYNKSFLAKYRMRVGIIDVGYNSGLSASIHHTVFINGNRYKMIGQKCMDFSFVQINDRIKENDEVELLGNNIQIQEVERIEKKDKYELYVNIK